MCGGKKSALRQEQPCRNYIKSHQNARSYWIKSFTTELDLNKRRQPCFRGTFLPRQSKETSDLSGSMWGNGLAYTVNGCASGNFPKIQKGTPTGKTGGGVISFEFVLPLQTSPLNPAKTTKFGYSDYLNFCAFISPPSLAASSCSPPPLVSAGLITSREAFTGPS